MVILSRGRRACPEFVKEPVLSLSKGISFLAVKIFLC
jgi:hypothetical protein